MEIYFLKNNNNSINVKLWKQNFWWRKDNIKRIMKKKIEVLVRAIIQERGKILICKKIGKDYRGKNYYFFPGGHVEFGESAKEALERELKEELGLRTKKSFFIGGSEHQFIEEGKKYHEINLVFQVLTDKIKTKSKEDHLQFFLMDKDQLSKEKVLPTVLTKAVLKWLKTKKPFWVSEI